MKHSTFLNHFIFCLGISVIVFYAWISGAITTVYINDASHMTSLMAIIFIGIVFWLGKQAWNIKTADTSLGYLGERLLPMVGLFGTAFGLSLQAQTLVGGAAAFGPLATSLYCTASGVLGAALIAVMTYNIEYGVKRKNENS